MKFRDEPDFLTQILLIEAFAVGIKTIAICKESKRVKSSVGFPYINYSVFSDEETGGWPAAWRAAENSGMYAGCGNSGQAQIREQLPPSVWKLVKDEWRKVE